MASDLIESKLIYPSVEFYINVSNEKCMHLNFSCVIFKWNVEIVSHKTGGRLNRKLKLRSHNTIYKLLGSPKTGLINVKSTLIGN